MLKYVVYEQAKQKMLACVYDKDEIKFPISALAVKVSKKSLDRKEVFHYTETYIKKRGLSSQIFNAYKDAYDVIDDPLSVTYESVQKVCFNILDILDVDDIIKFIYEEDIQAVGIMKKSFDVNKEADRLLSSDQTYLIDEYKELMALVIVSKIIFPVLAHSASINESLYTLNKDMSMMHLISDHPIFNHRVVTRLKAYIQKHYDTMISKRYASENERENAKRIISSSMSIASDDIEFSILSILFVRRMAMIPFYKQPPPTQHIPSITYTLIDSLVNRTSAIGPNAIRIKVATYSNDTRSIMESTTPTTSTGVGVIYEYNIALRDPKDILSKLFKRKLKSTEITLLNKVVKEFSILTTTHKNTTINDATISLLSFLLDTVGDIIDSRAISALYRETLVSAMCACYTYLYLTEEYTLANAIALVEDKDSDIIELLELRSISSENKEKLNKYWHSKTKVSKAGVVLNVTNNIYDRIGDITVKLMSGTYSQIKIPGLDQVEISPDIKNIWAAYLIREMENKLKEEDV